MRWMRIRNCFAASPTAAIVSMSDVVECLYNKECGGKVVIDDTLKAAIEQYGAK